MIMKLTKKQRLLAYNKTITSFKAKFKAGKVMTREDFVDLFNIPDIVHKGTYAEVHRSNLRLVQAQTEINVLMRENGLYLSSRDYYSEFYVRDMDYTKAAIKRLSANVDICNAYATRLEDRMVKRIKNGNWGTYNKVKPSYINNMGFPEPSPRHKATIKRVKHI